VTYRVPAAVRTGSTTIAVNVGGAIVPAAVAIYLICHDRLPLTALFATLVVTALVFAVARPVAGVGIVTPSLVPPLAAALAAIWLGGHFVAAVAYVAGTSGTPGGSRPAQLPRVRSLRAPMVSIGARAPSTGFPHRAGRRPAGVGVTALGDLTQARRRFGRHAGKCVCAADVRAGAGRTCRTKGQRAAGPCGS
jgi:Protein of unknown function (DUF1614)